MRESSAARPHWLVSRLRAVASRLIAAIDWLSDRTGKVVSLLIVFMIGAMAYEVIARYAFDSPTIWARETVQFLLGGYTILGGAYVLRHSGHVNMDILHARLSARRRAMVDVLTATLFVLFCGVLFWYGVDYAWKSISIGETTGSTWNPPEAVVKITIPLGALLVLLQGLSHLVRNLVIVVRGTEPE